MVRFCVADGSGETTFGQIASGLAGEVGLPRVEHCGQRQIPAHLQLPLEGSLDERVRSSSVEDTRSHSLSLRIIRDKTSQPPIREHVTACGRSEFRSRERPQFT